VATPEERQRRYRYLQLKQKQGLALQAEPIITLPPPAPQVTPQDEAMAIGDPYGTMQLPADSPIEAAQTVGRGLPSQVSLKRQYRSLNGLSWLEGGYR
jgi:hypothetical protein